MPPHKKNALCIRYFLSFRKNYEDEVLVGLSAIYKTRFVSFRLFFGKFVWIRYTRVAFVRNIAPYTLNYKLYLLTGNSNELFSWVVQFSRLLKYGQPRIL